MKSRIHLFTSLFLFCAIFWIIAYLILGNWFTDDAYITFRYARNFFNGFGLVFNAGEYVQGYTNFLWIIFLTGMKYLHINFQTSAILINSMSFILFSYIIFCFLLKLFPGKPKIFYHLSVVLFLSAPNLLSWVVGGGLEEPLFTTLLAVSFYFLFYKEGKTLGSIFFVISTLVRPEGCLFFFLALFYLVYFEKCKKKNLFIFLIVYIVPITCYLIWTYFYYGSILPNTFYAKVSFSLQGIFEGIHYLYRYLMSSPFILLLLIISIMGIKRKKEKIKFFWIIVIIFICYLIVVGGDFMYAYRFFLPILPFIYFLLIDEIEDIFTLLKSNLNSKKTLYYAFIFLTLYNLLSLSYFNDYKYQIQNYKMIQGGKILAEYINKKYPSNCMIAASGIGALGYYSDMKILDVLGLTNKAVAKEGINGKDIIYSHRKSNMQYILSQKPQIIVFGMPPGEKFPVRFAEKEIYNSPFFNKNYQYIETRLNPSIIIKFYLLKNFSPDKN